MMSRSRNRSAAAGRALDGCQRAYGGRSPMVPAGRRKRVRFVVVEGIEAMWTWIGAAIARGRGVSRGPSKHRRD